MTTTFKGPKPDRILSTIHIWLVHYFNQPFLLTPFICSYHFKTFQSTLPILVIRHILRIQHAFPFTPIVSVWCVTEKPSSFHTTFLLHPSIQFWTNNFLRCSERFQFLTPSHFYVLVTFIRTETSAWIHERAHILHGLSIHVNFHLVCNLLPYRLKDFQHSRSLSICFAHLAYKILVSSSEANSSFW